MKTTKIYMAMIAIAMVPFTMISCGDPWYYDDPYYHNHYGPGYDDYGPEYNDNRYDEPYYDNNADMLAEAQCLRGHWQGTMVDEFTNDKGQRQQVQYDADIEFDQYNSNSLSGRGREIDVAGSESQELVFTWFVDAQTGNIHIKYDGGSIVVIDANSKDLGFYLDDNQFYGYMVGQNIDDVIYFDLARYTYAKESDFSAVAKAKANPQTVTSTKAVAGVQADRQTIDLTNIPVGLPKRK
jgi:hypothetical protein